MTATSCGPRPVVVVTEEILRAFKTGQQGTRMLALTPDGKPALVPCAGANELAVFDVAARQEIKRVKTGGFRVGLLIEPDGLRAFVA